MPHAMCSAVGVLIQSPREAWRLLSPELTQNSLSTLSAANALLPCPINGCPSPKERPIRAASSREPLPACGPCVSQGPCELSASPVRQVVQAGWGAGRWPGGRWRSEERGWRFTTTRNRLSNTASEAGDEARTLTYDDECNGAEVRSLAEEPQVEAQRRAAALHQ